MAENPIDRVREAELRADEVMRKATSEAAGIISEAKKEAGISADAAIDVARDEAASKIAGAHKESQIALEAALTSLDGEMNALTQTARAKQEEAVRGILKALA